MSEYTIHIRTRPSHDDEAFWIATATLPSGPFEAATARTPAMAEALAIQALAQEMLTVEREIRRDQSRARAQASSQD